MSTLRTDILRACNGEIVRLPHNAEQAAIQRQLIAEGLIVSAYDNDQPTHYLTTLGEIALRHLKERPFSE